MRNARLSLPAGMWYNSSKQSLKHWKNACRRETLLPQSGNAIFHKGWPCVYGMIASNILFEALENAYCTAATPSCAGECFVLML